MNYQHIFFDLDHTLWDYEANSKKALEELFNLHDLGKYNGLTTPGFVERFFEVNETLWKKYDRAQINSEELRSSRFHLILNDFGLTSNEIVAKISVDYLRFCPQKTEVMPHTFEVLEYLKGRYRLHIITNGFYEVQFTKMDCSGLTTYFEEIITSEEAGFRKPDPQIFEYILTKLGASRTECIMIGDNLNTDILGASNASIDHVFYNPAKSSHQANPTYEIESLRELKEIL